MKSIVEILNINESTEKFDVQNFIEQFKYILRLGSCRRSTKKSL